jgi:hypothetical protein
MLAITFFFKLFYDPHCLRSLRSWHPHHSWEYIRALRQPQSGPHLNEIQHGDRQRSVHVEDHSADSTNNRVEVSPYCSTTGWRHFHPVSSTRRGADGAIEESESGRRHCAYITRSLSLLQQAGSVASLQSVWRAVSREADERCSLNRQAAGYTRMRR